MWDHHLCRSFHVYKGPDCEREVGEIVFYTICGIVSLLIVSSNVIVISVFMKNKRLRNSQAIYKTSIAFSDLIVGLFVIPSVISLLVGPAAVSSDTRTSLSILVAGAWIVTFFVSLSTLTAMGFDRMFAVVYPLKYGACNSKRNALYVSAGIWIFAILFLPGICFMAYHFLGELMTESRTMFFLGGKISHTVILFFAMTLVWSSGIAVFTAVRSQSQRIACAIHTLRLNRQKKLAITLCIMIAAFSLSVCPTLAYLIYIIAVPNHAPYQYLKNPSLHVPDNILKFESAVSLIFLTNSLWNCVVYSFRSKRFRHHAAKLFCKRFRHVGSESRCKSATPLSESYQSGPTPGSVQLGAELVNLTSTVRTFDEYQNQYCLTYISL